jgi:hypothetical protein
LSHQQPGWWSLVLRSSWKDDLCYIRSIWKKEKTFFTTVLHPYKKFSFTYEEKTCWELYIILPEACFTTLGVMFDPLGMNSATWGDPTLKEYT